MGALRTLGQSLGAGAVALVFAACGESEGSGGGESGSPNGGSAGARGGSGGTGAAWFEVLEPLPTVIVGPETDPTLVRNETLVTGASADGSVLVGESWATVADGATAYTSQTFRFTRESGMENLGTVGDPMPDRVYVFPRLVSRDGSVVVGSYGVGTLGPLYRWTAETGMVPLDTSGEAGSITLGDLSDDGSVLVGTKASEAVRWTENDGLVGLGFLAGDTVSSGSRLSGDGSALIGLSGESSDLFRWSEDDGMVALGPSLCFIPQGGVSSDGATVVGQCVVPEGVEIFVWTEAQGAHVLGTIPTVTPFTSMAASTDGAALVGQGQLGREDYQGYRVDEASGVVALGQLPDLPTCFLLGRYFTDEFVGRSPANRDASVIVGNCFTTSGTADQRGFRWTEATGLVALAPLAGQVETLVTSISPDGIVGGVSIGESGGDEAVIWDDDGTPESIRKKLESAGVAVGDFSLDHDVVVVDGGRIVYGLGHDAEGAGRSWAARLR